MRGTWFVDGTWEPLEETYSTQIENDHLTFFRGHKLPSDKPDPKASVPGIISRIIVFTKSLLFSCSIVMISDLMPLLFVASIAPRQVQRISC